MSTDRVSAIRAIGNASGWDRETMRDTAREWGKRSGQVRRARAERAAAGREQNVSGWAWQ